MDAPTPAPAATPADGIAFELLYDVMKREFCRQTGQQLGMIPPMDMREPEDIAAFEALCRTWFLPFIPTAPVA
jgi:hypothetical protein